MNNFIFGKTVKSLSNEILRFVSSSINLDKEDRYTTIQFLFMDYIGRFSSINPIFQRDLESEFNIRRSTATGILQVLEKSQLIVRRPRKEDARLKEIFLTQTGQEMFEKRKIQIEKIDQQLLDGITEEDLAVFLSVVDQVYLNIAKNEKNRSKGDLIRD